jgi:hypothetical protein
MAWQVKDGVDFVDDLRDQEARSRANKASLKQLRDLVPAARC